MKNKIVIIGAGEIGQAIKKVLQLKSGIIELWDKDISKNPNQKPLVDIVPSADFLFLCVPSWTMREALNSFLQYLNKKTITISLTKGIEEKTSKTTADILEELLPNKAHYALLIGPMLAEELMQGMVGIGVAASHNRETCNKIKALFIDTNLWIECSTDVCGTALAGVLKNIYAVGLGIADALNLSGNFKGWLTQKAVKEMAEIIKLKGGLEKTAFGSAGFADLIATGFSSYSRNRQVGEKLVKTGKYCLKSEGLNSLSSVLKLLSRDDIDRLLFLQALKKVVIQHKDAKTIFEKIKKEEKLI